MLHVRDVTGALHVVRNESRPTEFAAFHVAVANGYGTNGSDVPWNSKLGASPESIVPRRFAPESDTAPPTDAVGSSLELNPTCSTVIAPADEPPIAMRDSSMR